MKFTFGLSALVVLAANATSAAPSNSTLIPRADCISISLFWHRNYSPPSYKKDAVNDGHAFNLVVAGGRYNEWVPYRPTTGKKSNGYKETRKSNDGLWSVEHTDYESQPITLTAKGKKYPFKSVNRGATGDKSQWFEYFHCIEW
ncbi:hypothetical protein BGZ95_005713 [Linnemannia exigua]|uniref:Uncharacterized protein n=1 Tax=Linnemannia exigua TaxID=604196 RepID=A0AAD4DGI0_9FUNG|nr:hypothetical protein BGZ95_005713 [Linnemannia exigua]